MFPSMYKNTPRFGYNIEGEFKSFAEQFPVGYEPLPSASFGASKLSDNGAIELGSDNVFTVIHSGWYSVDINLMIHRTSSAIVSMLTWIEVQQPGGSFEMVGDPLEIYLMADGPGKMSHQSFQMYMRAGTKMLVRIGRNPANPDTGSIKQITQSGSMAASGATSVPASKATFYRMRGGR